MASPLSRLVAVAVVVAAAAAVTGLRAGWWTLPDRLDPWAPLAYDDAPNWLTRYKLHRLDGDPAQCLAMLATTPVAADPVPDADTAAGCTLRNAVRVRRAGVRLSAPVTLSCRAAVSLALWERHALQPAAHRLYGARVDRIEHFGSLACRNVGGAASGRRSQHASADAIDIAGFVFADGRRVSVARDWSGDDDSAAFLRDAHRGACDFFDAALGPGYDRAHADHFHLDRGPFRVCR